MGYVPQIVDSLIQEARPFFYVRRKKENKSIVEAPKNERRLGLFLAQGDDRSSDESAIGIKSEGFLPV